jgi:hypothetical protein
MNTFKPAWVATCAGLLLVLAITAAPGMEPSDLPVSQDTEPVLTVVDGEEGTRLSLAEIEELGLYEVELRHFDGLEGQFAGVRLERFIRAHGLDDAHRIRFIAADDYTIFLEPEQIAERGFLLVTRFDGEPIPRTEMGPLMLVVPDEAEAVREGERTPTDWIWALTEIRAR